MTYHDQQPRRFDEAPVEHRQPPDSGMNWGLPLGIAAAALVIGVIFFNLSHERSMTASNSGPGTTQSTPAPTTQNAPVPNTGTVQPPAKSQ